MIVTCGKIYDRCAVCGQLVRLNKPILGALHFCLTDEEIAYVRSKQMAQQQLAPVDLHRMLGLKNP